MLYIFQNQRLTTPIHSFPVHSPSLSAITLPLPLHSPSLSTITLPQSPPPSISLPHPFRSIAIAGTLVLCHTLFEPSPYPPPLITGTLLYRFTVLCCICFVGNGCLSEGDLALPKSSILFICFMGMTQVQILPREEKMIISAS